MPVNIRALTQHREKTLNLLKRLENEMINTKLWSDSAPSAQAMASTAPFACDTMPLESWLQFMFIPRMHNLIVSGLRLPDNISVHPIAEYHYAGSPEYAELIRVVADLDHHLNTAGSA